MRRLVVMKVLATLCVLLSAWRCAAEAPAITQLEVAEPRAFGYLIGDKLQRDVLLQVNAPYRLQLEQLPTGGRLTHWLTLEPPSIKTKRTQNGFEYRLLFTYQLINVVPNVTDIGLPEIYLPISDGKDTRRALIPVSRLRIGLVTDFAQADLRPAIKPLPLHNPRWPLIAWGSALWVALGGLAYLRSGLGMRQPPFAALVRRLSRQRITHWQTESYADALRAVHRAFDDTARRTLFGDTLDEFLMQNPRYVPLAAQVRRFYACSNRYFFGAHDDEPGFDYAPAELRAFVAACAACERA